MLIARGHAVSLQCSDGRTIRPKGAILQDEEGEALDPAVCIIMPFRKTGRRLVDPSPAARRHFGRTPPLDGRVVLPPLRSGWRKLCEVAEAEYSRRGEYEGDYAHSFGSRRLFRRDVGLPTLYVHSSGVMKLELAEGSYWDWSGVNN